MKYLLLLSLLMGCSANKECHDHPSKTESTADYVESLRVSVGMLAATNKCAKELGSLSGDNFKTMQAHVMMYDVTTDYYCEKIGKKKKERSKDLCNTMSNKGRREYYVRETVNLFLSKCILKEYEKTESTKSE